MGIKNLLKAFKSIKTSVHISKYKGKKLAVDGYSWLHKAAHIHGSEITLNQNYKPFLKSFLRKVQSLLKYKISVVIVFDGDRLPLKKETEMARSKTRKQGKKEAETQMKLGKIFGLWFLKAIVNKL
jgi:exonuclease-1